MSKKIIVSDDHRKNSLSLTPGGYVVTTVLKSGQRIEYDKIKNVGAYVDKVKLDRNVMEIWCENEKIWERITQ